MRDPQTKMILKYQEDYEKEKPPISLWDYVFQRTAFRVEELEKKRFKIAQRAGVLRYRLSEHNDQITRLREALEKACNAMDEMPFGDFELPAHQIRACSAREKARQALLGQEVNNESII